MDVKQIQYFSLVSSTGSFNAAAKQLYISVPVWSRRWTGWKTSWAFSSLCAGVRA